MKKTILLTGFEPFGGHTRNPSQEIARGLNGWMVHDAQVHSLTLPVDTKRAPAILIAKLDQLNPAAVLSLGLAADRSVLSIERVAINLMHFNIPDNAGVRERGSPIVAGGPAEHVTTLPVRRILAAMRAARVPCEISSSAGFYLCNQIMYTALHYYATRRRSHPAGFIHLPVTPEMIGRGSRHPPMPFEMIQRGIRVALRVIARAISAEPSAVFPGLGHNPVQRGAARETQVEHSAP
jgi:pyroglutamyl-peptidase